MKILVFGAGVIGSIYAARLHKAGYDVTILARNKRYEFLIKNGISLRNSVSKELSVTNTRITQKLAKDDFYDLIIVSVQLKDLADIVAVLKSNTVCKLIVFMLNNAGGWEDIAHELRPKHIILGFPGVGGIHQGHLVNYIQIKQQKTTIGELNGEDTPAIREIKRVLENAKFTMAVSYDMQAWLKTHAVFVSCVTAAIMKENGDSIQLSRNRGGVRSLVKSIREGFLACEQLGLPVSPANLKIIFLMMPLWFSVTYWQKALKGKMGTLALSPHANAAKVEMQMLAKMTLAMVHSSNLPTPTLDMLLLSFIKNVPFSGDYLKKDYHNLKWGALREINKN